MDNHRFIEIDGWIFETKGVRALKVEKYGEPYNAIANCVIACDNMYIDGVLTKEGINLFKRDFAVFVKYCELVNINTIHYHRYYNEKVELKTFDVATRKHLK